MSSVIDIIMEISQDRTIAGCICLQLVCIPFLAKAIRMHRAANAEYHASDLENHLIDRK